MKESVHEMTIRVPTKNVGFVLELTEGIDQGPKGMHLEKIHYSMTGTKAPKAPKAPGPGRGKGQTGGPTGGEIIAKLYAPGTAFQRPLAVQAIVKTGRSKSYAQQTISDLLRQGKLVKQLDGSYLVAPTETSNGTNQ